MAIITSSTLGYLCENRNPLTADALAELRADRLAALLLDAVEHDATVARRLRIAVAARGGADSAAAAIDAEIRRLKRGTSLVDYQANARICPRPVGVGCRYRGTARGCRSGNWRSNAWSISPIWRQH